MGGRETRRKLVNPRYSNYHYLILCVYQLIIEARGWGEGEFYCLCARLKFISSVALCKLQSSSEFTLTTHSLKGKVQKEDLS
jgi:hypothetical protein